MYRCMCVRRRVNYFAETVKIFLLEMVLGR